MNRRAEFLPYLSLLIAISGFTMGSSFLKLAQINGMPTSVIVAGRLLLSTLVLTPLVLFYYRTEMRQINRNDLLRVCAAGAFLTIHLLMIVESLKHTNILFNQILVNTGPVWVALLEVFLLKVRFSRMVWLGLAICIAGGSLIFVISALQGAVLYGSNILLGNALALGGAVFGGIYIILGRQMRQKVSLVPYLWLTFGVGGLVALLFNIINSISMFGYSSEANFWLVMVTVFPTLIGHTFFNNALGYLSATLVTLSGQVVTLTGTIAAFFIFGERPTLPAIFAGCIIVVGVLIAAAGQRRKPKVAAAPTG